MPGGIVEGNAVPETFSRSGQGDSVADLEKALARATRELELAEVKERKHYGPVAHSTAAERPLPAGESHSRKRVWQRPYLDVTAA